MLWYKNNENLVKRKMEFVLEINKIKFEIKVQIDNII